MGNSANIFVQNLKALDVRGWLGHAHGVMPLADKIGRHGAAISMHC